MDNAFNCPVRKKCGGCQLQNLTYPEQLDFKQGREITLLGQFGHVSRILGMDDPTHYRCKVQAAFDKGRDGVISGVWQSSTRRVVPVDSCLIEDTLCDEIIVTIRKLLKSFRIKLYDPESGAGFFRHALVRRGCFTGQVMVVLVTGPGEFPSQRSFVNALTGRHPEITTVVRNVNTKKLNLTLGSESIPLFGDGYIEDTLLGCAFRISPASFYQVNPRMTETLYSKAIALLSLTGTETVLDAYCGTGTIGILLSRQAGKVIGVEKSADAVADARWNAARNQISNIEFRQGDASAYIEELAKRGESLNAVVMDPPRAGSDVRFLRALTKLRPKKVVYVSCEPETLARDLKYLTGHGYGVNAIQPVDLFPFTKHCETVCSLVLNSAPKLAISTLSMYNNIYA